MRSDRNLDHLYPPFRHKVVQLIQELDAYAVACMPGARWSLIEGFRTAAYQNHLYQKGRTIKPIGRRHVVTFCDGYRRRSSHQSSLAVDIVPMVGRRLAWDAEPKHWAKLSELARRLGLTWGGDWKKIRDKPHVEWPRRDLATYEAARAWQRERGLA